MDSLVSIRRTAQRLDVSHWTIRSWVSKGKLKSVKLGARRMIPESELVRVMSEGIPSRIIGTR
jgi:excisionase family DNA binding protein